MKDFLRQKHNVEVSAYITDLNPSQITTNGAFTIIDNSDPSNNIDGLPTNSYCLFLDDQFLASGYGFSSFSYYEKSTYIASTFSGIYSYIINELDNLHNNTITLNYSYNSYNIIDKEYSTYGWVKRYKKLEIERVDNTKYDVKLTTVDCPYVNNIILNCNINSEDDECTYIAPIDSNSISSVSVKLKLHKSAGNGDITALAPEIIFNGEPIDLNNTEIIRNIERQNQTIFNKDLELICKRDNDVVYSYTFKNAIKWRYRMLPLNLESNVDDNIKNNLRNLNNHRFSDISDSESVKSSVSYFITKFKNDFIYLDDTNDIEFNGIQYQYNNLIESSYDYIIIEGENHDVDFYLNNIKTNNWSHILISDNNKNYIIYQSPQKYIGVHTWKVCCKYE